MGDNESVPIDVRIIAATNRDLKQRIGAGLFREDLYYRLNVVTITMPPLRERLDDLPLLAQHFLHKHARAAGKPVTGFARETFAVLSRYSWPGNVRELEHTIERAVALASASVLIPDDLPIDVLGSAPDLRSERPKTLEEVKRWYVNAILGQTQGNKAQAAELLGIDRRTLYRMLERSAPDDADPQ